MGQNFIRFSRHVTPIEHLTWFTRGTSYLLKNPRYGLTQESAEKYRREDKIRTLMTMRIMESDGDVMLGTCRGPNSEEALSIPMMLLRGMTNRYTFVKLGLFITLP